MATRDPPRRRIFIQDGTGAYQLFSIEQGSDASFYVSCPDFDRSKWIEICDGEAGEKAINVASSPGPGKLSVHGSGYAGIRAHDAEEHRVVVRGNRLMSQAGNVMNVRHLLSVLPTKPAHRPSSPEGARASDVVLKSSRPLRPMAFLFFALPRRAGIASVSFQFTFHVDDIDTPPDMSWGEITFPLHSLVAVIYSAKGMQNWPASSHFCHHDGHSVPLFMGGGPAEWRFTAVRPSYALEGNELKITLSAYTEAAA